MINRCTLTGTSVARPAGAGQGDAMSISRHRRRGGCQRQAPENMSSTDRDPLVSDVGHTSLTTPENHPFGRTVGGPGAVVVQDLLGPAFEGVAQGADLCHLVALAADDGLLEEC